VMKKRNITKPAAEGGQPCDGPLELSIRCNPADGEVPPAGCNQTGMPVDCRQDDWSEWSTCSTTCGQGHKSRTRMVTLPPANGGQLCDNPMKETRMCSIATCPTNPDNSCEWDEWLQWSNCDALTGQTSRTRTIAVQKALDGKDCLGPASETKKCERTCEDKPYTCTHSPWSQWSACSKTCGIMGRKTRKRQLVIKDAPQGATVTDSVNEYDATLQTRLSASRSPTAARGVSMRVQQLGAAFALGCGSLTAVAFAVRLLRRPSGTSSALATSANPTSQTVAPRTSASGLLSGADLELQ
jgi:hypothetical protein